MVERRFHANGLYSDRFGEGEAVVLVHGWSMHSGVWRDFAPPLARHFHIICIDLPGHGHSAMIDDFSLDGIVRALLEIAPEKACWVGWSLGAALVLYLAWRYPERVKALILIAGNAKFVQGEGWTSAMAAGLWEHFASELAQNRQSALHRFLGLQCRGTASAKSLLRALRGLSVERPAADSRALREGLAILRAADLRRGLAGLHCPGLIVLGERDALVPVEAGRAMQALWPEAELYVVEEAGHLPFYSHSQEVCAESVKFLRRHGQG